MTNEENPENVYRVRTRGVHNADRTGRGIEYSATVLADPWDDGHGIVDLYNGYSHDGGIFPVEDLDTVIAMLTTLRDILAAK